MKKQMVEYAGQPVGIVVPDDGRLRFVAVKFHVHGLDGRIYDTMDDLRRAIMAHVGKGTVEGISLPAAG
ncbi:hypothetical protein FJU08_10575 [Martelella alba]|uniref:Uncharacterized protein n=1 Tax=Martelella alba TaxID=2590451 RepID=A0A506UBY0_9HYPH|nr:hypothetical protein [Martelella alba]TPW31088.1 hypothetical protein FJU08_10575 [Martelella alba]